MKTWMCKVGETDSLDLSDEHMRSAVIAAYRSLTGSEPQFVLSGWGGQLDEMERAEIERRDPDFFASRYLENKLHRARAGARESMLEHNPRAIEDMHDVSAHLWLAHMLVRLGQLGQLLTYPEDPRLTDVTSVLLSLAMASLDAIEALSTQGQPNEEDV